jgi:hypothetical protein
VGDGMGAEQASKHDFRCNFVAFFFICTLETLHVYTVCALRLAPH